MVQIKDSINNIIQLSLQKYMMHLRRAENEAEERRYLLAAEMWNLSRDALEEAFNYYQGQGV